MDLSNDVEPPDKPRLQAGRKCLKSRQSVIIVAPPLTLTLSPEAGERGFFRLPLPLEEGWGEGAFPRIDAQSCYDVWCVPSFETFSESLHHMSMTESAGTALHPWPGFHAPEQKGVPPCLFDSSWL